jgi:hypothetical protein
VHGAFPKKTSTALRINRPACRRLRGNPPGFQGRGTWRMEFKNSGCFMFWYFEICKLKFNCYLKLGISQSLRVSDVDRRPFLFAHYHGTRREEQGTRPYQSSHVSRFTYWNFSFTSNSVFLFFWLIPSCLI